MRRILGVLLILVFVFFSNTLFIQPREIMSDVDWLLYELTREETVRDVRRLGPLQITPTKVAVGEAVEVVVAEASNNIRRALVMLDDEGNHLETRYDPLDTQIFVIPPEAKAGEYRFWLAAASRDARSGMGVITLEVYAPLGYSTTVSSEVYDSVSGEVYDSVSGEVYETVSGEVYGD